MAQRDPGVQEMVEYFDRWAGRYENWDDMSPEERFSTLKKGEREAILEQASYCIDDFAYASRNYFKITNKRGEDQLFSLWESQWLLLQKYYELKAQGKAQRIMILKARQLGMSLLIEAMIAWRTMFFPNTNGLVISVVKDDSADLFSLMLHIYDHMPWWLKPQRASREERDGLWFDNPDPDARRLRPGLNSRIFVQHSNQVAGVGQGKRLSAVHCSEYTDYLPKHFKEIIEGDLLHAIADNSESFAFLESTGRGAGSYSHKLWKTCEALAERSEWYPLFMPWFFESTRVTAPPPGWHIQKPESAMRERVALEWVRCDHCSQYFTAAIHGESRDGSPCPSCQTGVLRTCLLSDDQLYWKETRRINAEMKDKESLKKHRSEMACTAEEAWQLSGICVFDEDCQDKAVFTLRDPKKCPDVRVGKLTRNGIFHGLRGESGCWAEGCREDHRFDEVNEETNFTIWQMPLKGFRYAVGVDISEGIGQDYSTIVVIKLTPWCDEQVAVWRSNAIDPLDLAFYVDAIGRMYNEAMMCIEYNTGFRATADQVRFKYLYPNLFQWKHLDSRNPLGGGKLHWYTQYNTKPLLWQTLRKRIKAGVFILRDPVTYAEMQTFQKDDEDDRMAAHEKGSHDDTLIATMIALYCSHEMEADESGNIPLTDPETEEQTGRYLMTCLKCGAEWRGENPERQFRCPVEKCGSIRLKARLLEQDGDRRATVDFSTLEKPPERKLPESYGML